MYQRELFGASSYCIERVFWAGNRVYNVKIMSLNCVEINAILDELDLKGSFIQNIIQPSYDSLALYLYRQEAKTLLICLAAGACRIHETRRKIPKNDKPLRFMEFLRSRVKGSRIVEVEQLGLERIIKLTLLRAEETLFMYIRLWSGAANIVVTNEDQEILDAFYRRPKRGETCGGMWKAPEIRSNTDESRWKIRELPGAASFNEKIDLWYAEHAETLSREALLEDARRQYDSSRDRLSAAVKNLEKKRESFLHADRHLHQGDLLMAYLHEIPAYAEFVELPDYENDGVTIRIPLDPRLSGRENAEACYKRYRKAVSGLSNLEDDIALTRASIERLDAEYTAVCAEQNPHVIRKVLRQQNTPRQQIKKQYPGLVYRKDGWLFLVGRTAAENDELLRRHVRGLDMWLHTRDWPGGYVFIKNRRDKTVPLEILLDAGNLALFYSKGRKAGTADLYYTQVKHLRRAKNAPKGTVLPTNEKNLSVKLDPVRLKNLETCRDMP